MKRSKIEKGFFDEGEAEPGPDEGNILAWSVTVALVLIIIAVLLVSIFGSI